MENELIDELYWFAFVDVSGYCKVWRWILLCKRELVSCVRTCHQKFRNMYFLNVAFALCLFFAKVFELLPVPSVFHIRQNWKSKYSALNSKYRTLISIQYAN